MPVCVILLRFVYSSATLEHMERGKFDKLLAANPLHNPFNASILLTGKWAFPHTYRAWCGSFTEALIMAQSMTAKGLRGVEIEVAR
jgi:hypothetical protein